MKSINTTRGVRQDGTTPYQITVRVPGFAGSRSGTFDTLEECDDFRIKAERMMRLQAPELPTRAKPITQEELDRESVKSTVQAYLRSKYATKRDKAHSSKLLKGLGQVRRSGITIAWIEDFIADMRAQKTYRGTPYSWETIRIFLTLVGKSLRWRADHQRLVNVPLPFRIEIMFPKGWRNKRTRRFEVGEEEKLMQRLSEIRHHRSRPFWILFVQLALETGARLQEVLNAKWSDLTWDECDWHILISKTGPRHVPLSIRAMDLFRQLHELRHPASDRVFHELGTPETVSALFRRYSREAGLVGFRLHDLRHEAISRLVATKRKASMTLIGLMVGHSGEAMTEHYSHLRGRETAALLD